MEVNLARDAVGVAVGAQMIRSLLTQCSLSEGINIGRGCRRS